MHEGALAYSTATALIEYAKDNNIREVKIVEIGIGELTMIDEETYTTWLTEYLKGSPYENAKITLIKEPVKFKCNICNNEWTLNEVKDKIMESYCKEVDCDTPIHYLPEIAPAYVTCPKCGSRDFEIIEGEGIRIRSIRYVE
ncbi:MAG: hydrogenase/urease maturation nickel metallochaperone HypA [Saccharolobus sp.]